MSRDGFPLLRRGALIFPAFVPLFFGAAPAAQAGPLRYLAVTPCRVFDSRTDPGVPVDEIGTSVPVGGVCDVPFPEAKSVAINVTAVSPTATGFVRVSQTAISSPADDAVGFAAGQTRANNRIAHLDYAGFLHASTSGVGITAHVVIDVFGYFVENTAPVVTTSAGAAAFAEDGPAATVDGGLTLEDATDDNLVSATVTITNPQDGAAESLAATNCAGLTLTPGLNTLAVTGTQPLAVYETCLRSATFHDAAQNPNTTQRIVAFAASDGEATSPESTRAVSFTAFNDAPVLTTTCSPTSYTEGDPAVVVDGLLQVADADSASLSSATATILNVQDGAAEQLAATSCAGLLVTPGLNTLSITGSQPLATYQTCLRSVTFIDASSNPGTAMRLVSFVASDGVTSGAPAARTLLVTAVDNAPFINNLSGDNVNYFAGAGALVVDSGADALLTDADDPTLVGATVTLQTAPDGGSELLGVASGSPASILFAYNSGTRVLTLAGVASVSDYQAALRKVTYTNVAGSPTAGPRLVEFVVKDFTSSSSAAQATVDVQP
jgi:hypothetical protein